MPLAQLELGLGELDRSNIRSSSKRIAPSKSLTLDLKDNARGKPLHELVEQTLNHLLPQRKDHAYEQEWLMKAALRAVCEAVMFYGAKSFFTSQDLARLDLARLSVRVAPKHKNWKGSFYTQHGYVKIYVGKGHHLARGATGYAYEHRLVAEKMLNRRLLREEVVHHINGNKTDNRPENLQIFSSNAEHRNNHRKPGSRVRDFGSPNPIIACACGCGRDFPKYDKTNRPRQFFNAGCSKRAYRRPNPIVSCECGCGTTFNLYNAHGYKRRFAAGHAARANGRKGGLSCSSKIGVEPN